MKNVSEAAVGLAYSALLFHDQGLAAEVSQLEDRLDEMREQLELWVLRAGGRDGRPVAAARPAAPRRARPRRSATPPSSSCGSSRRTRRCTRCSRSRSARPTTWSCSIPIAAGTALDGAQAGRHQLGDDTGFHLLAIRRGGRYLYRPRGRIALEAGDEILAAGPWEGRATLAEQCGFRLVEDDDTGEVELGAGGYRPAAHSATMIASTPTATTPT